MPYLVYKERIHQEWGVGLWDKDPPEQVAVRSSFDGAMSLMQRFRGVDDSHTYYLVCRRCRQVCYSNRMGGPCCEGK